MCMYSTCTCILRANIFQCTCTLRCVCVINGYLSGILGSTTNSNAHPLVGGVKRPLLSPDKLVTQAVKIQLYVRVGGVSAFITNVSMKDEREGGGGGGGEGERERERGGGGDLNNGRKSNSRPLLHVHRMYMYNVNIAHSDVLLK